MRRFLNLIGLCNFHGQSLLIKQMSYSGLVLPERPVPVTGWLIQLDPITRTWYYYDPWTQSRFEGDGSPVCELERGVASSRTPTFGRTSTPKAEIIRHRCMVSLKDSFLELCKDICGVDAPKGSFGRWHLAMLALYPSKTESILPTKTSETYPALEDELRQKDVLPELFHRFIGEFAEFAVRSVEEALAEISMAASDASIVQLETLSQNVVQLHCLGAKVRICVRAMEALRERFERLDCNNDKNFETSLFCMLMRYRALDGGEFQAACPDEVFEFMRCEFSVSMECFASPLNASTHTSGYCSAFPDVDTPFGSVGSFFSWVPDEGSFEANPPFELVTMHLMAQRFDELLHTSSQPLSFTIVVPKWNDDSCTMWNVMSNSPFLVQQFDIPKGKHMFYRGQQHELSLASRQWRANHVTTVFILQNPAGKITYKVSKEKMREMKQRWQSLTPKTPAKNSRKTGSRARHNPVSSSWRTK